MTATSQISSLLPNGPRKKRIARIVGTFLVTFAVLLFFVSTLSVFGLQRFHASLSDITENSFASVVRLSSKIQQVNEIVVLAEQLRHVENEIELRLVYIEIQEQLANLSSDIDDAVTTQTHSATYLRAIRRYVSRLYTLKTEYLAVEKDFFTKAQYLCQYAQSIREEPIALESTLDPVQRALVAETTKKLQELLERNRGVVLTVGALKPYQLRQEVRDELDVLYALLASDGTGGVTFADLRQRVHDAERLLLGQDGVFETLKILMQLNSKIISVNNLAYATITDATNTQVSLLNSLIDRANSTATTTAGELKFFTQVLGCALMVSVIMAISVFLYMRYAVILRLENLNTAVLERVKGKHSAIETNGTDEIATIAQSVDYFTTELSVSRDLAEASNKAKSEFLANMSHEIRTPMNAIIGFTRMTLETELSAEQKGYIGKINSSARFLLNIINDILDFSKIEAGKLDIESVPFELSKILESITSITEAKIKTKPINFVFKQDESIPPILVGDQVRLFQILNNLLDNAVKFTGNGTVGLTLECLEQTDERVLIHFVITDQGIGLTQEQIDKLFKSFSQADTSTTRKFGGTGLGLAICKSLCEMMGGSIAVTSEYGQGSTFAFTLPFAYSYEMQSLPEEHASENADLRGERILLVEDNEINQEIALALLQKTGVVIDIASNGLEALEMVNKTHYRLVLMDIQMPEMDGIAATKCIRAMPDKRFSIMPIIAMTAHAMDSDRTKSLEAGMTDHISKPLEPDVLYASLEKWVLWARAHAQEMGDDDVSMVKAEGDIVV